MPEPTVAILDGSTFVVSDRRGDIDARPDQAQGFFFRDTRHLSRWRLRVNWSRPVEYPTASSPQAWAAGAPLLAIRTLLGLEPEGDHLAIDPVLPKTFRRLEVRGVLGCWGRADTAAERTEARPLEEVIREWFVARPE